jgi:hypothetical protein
LDFLQLWFADSGYRCFALYAPNQLAVGVLRTLNGNK